MQTKFMKAALALPILAGSMFVAGATARADDAPSPTPTPTATPTQPDRGKKDKKDKDRDDKPKEGPGKPVDSTFSFPVNTVVVVNGQNVRVSGVVAGTAVVHESASGNLHVRADVLGRGITVTLANGTVLRGAGEARVVANIRGTRGKDSFFNTSAVVNLVGPNNTAYRLTVRLRVRIDAQRRVTVTVVGAQLSSSTTTS